MRRREAGRPTADGGRAITDAAIEAYEIVNIGRRLAGEQPVAPKRGARFHFEFPGSVHGFQPEQTTESRGTVSVENVPGHSEAGERSLALGFRGPAPGRVGRVAAPIFVPSLEVASYSERRGYALLASPSLHPGQTLLASVIAAAENAASVECRLYLRHYGERDELDLLAGPEARLEPGRRALLEWRTPDTQGYRIAFVGVQVAGDKGATGTIYLDYLDWDGEPDVKLDRPPFSGTMWKRAWVNGLDHHDRLDQLEFWPEPYRLVQNYGRGLLMQGSRQWKDYRAAVTMTPHLCKAGGVAVRVQGKRPFPTTPSQAGESGLSARKAG
jgi:hypothetical protein